MTCPDCGVTVDEPGFCVSCWDARVETGQRVGAVKKYTPVQQLEARRAARRRWYANHRETILTVAKYNYRQKKKGTPA